MEKEQELLKSQYTRDQVEKLSIDTAMERNWTIHHRDIDVKVSGGSVTLTGTVNTKYERDAAGRIAMQSGYCFSVNNNIQVTNTNRL